MGDKVLLHVCPMRGAMRFGTRGKLSPMSINVYDILKRVEKLPYRLSLPKSLRKVLGVFHVLAL